MENVDLYRIMNRNGFKLDNLHFWYLFDSMFEWISSNNIIELQIVRIIS